jgi:hypothetical protein
MAIYLYTFFDRVLMSDASEESVNEVLARIPYNKIPIDADSIRDITPAGDTHGRYMEIRTTVQEGEVVGKLVILEGVSTQGSSLEREMTREELREIGSRPIDNEHPYVVMYKSMEGRKDIMTRAIIQFIPSAEN